MHTSLITTRMSFCELKNKEVVNVQDGSLLGCVTDIEFDICNGNILSLVLPGNGILASLSAKNKIIIPWCDIERIGKDTILVRYFLPPETLK